LPKRNPSAAVSAGRRGAAGRGGAKGMPPDTPGPAPPGRLRAGRRFQKGDFRRTLRGAKWGSLRLYFTRTGAGSSIYCSLFRFSQKKRPSRARRRPRYSFFWNSTIRRVRPRPWRAANGRSKAMGEAHPAYRLRHASASAPLPDAPPVARGLRHSGTPANVGAAESVFVFCGGFPLRFDSSFFPAHTKRKKKGGLLCLYGLSSPT